MIPVYNAEEHIRVSLESTLSQPRTALEVIVIDDGSDDSSLAIAKTIASRDKRVRLVSGPNKGVGTTRNKGLLLAKGQYVLFLDADDRFSPNSLSAVEAVLKQGNPDIALFRFSEARTGEARSGAKPVSWFSSQLQHNHPIAISNGVEPSDLRFINQAVWNKAFSRQFLETKKLAFNELFLFGAEDWDFLVRALAKANNILISPQELYVYTLGVDGGLSSNRLSQLREEVQVGLKLLRDFGAASHWAPAIRNRVGAKVFYFCAAYAGASWRGLGAITRSPKQPRAVEFASFGTAFGCLLSWFVAGFLTILRPSHLARPSWAK